MELIIIGLFSITLFGCIVANISVLYALLIGYVLFFSYGILKKHSFKDLMKMSFQGVNQIRGILLVFVFIGMITATWRAAGTIPFIIYNSSQLIIPSIFILITFLLNCLISVLTGTSVGTSATIGIICMSLGNIMGVNEIFVGGAILSGAYFGDRCSPVSTSALLVATLTQTSIYKNIKLMLYTGFVPFIATCVIYLLLGFTTTAKPQTLDILNIIPDYFKLYWIVLLPAILIIFLALFKVKVLWLMSVSVIVSCLICVFIQNIAVTDLVQILIWGYHIDNPQLAVIFNGGGILSMLKVIAIICISSTYSGIFNGTGILKGLKKSIAASSKYLGLFGSTLLTAFCSAIIACNQTLAIMLTYMLCKELTPDNNEMAINLEDTAVVVSPLIPWSIASVAPLAAMGGSSLSITLACYVYLIPLWRLTFLKRYPPIKK